MYYTGSFSSSPLLESNYSTTFLYEHFFQTSLISHSFCFPICKCWYRYDFLEVKVVNFMAALLCRSKVQAYSLVHATGVAGFYCLPLVFLSKRVSNFATGIYLITATHPYFCAWIKSELNKRYSSNWINKRNCSAKKKYHVIWHCLISCLPYFVVCDC
jgi:hypothetical protein